MGRRGALAVLFLLLVGAAVLVTARQGDEVAHVPRDVRTSAQGTAAVATEPQTAPRPRAAIPEPGEDAARSADRAEAATATESPPADERSHWRVTVLGRDDVPAPGLRLRVRDGTTSRDVFTGADGSADVPCAPDATDLEVEAPGFRGVGADGGQALRAKLAERGSTLRLPEVPSLTVVTVDAETGSEVPTPVRIRIGSSLVAEITTPGRIVAAPFATDPVAFRVAPVVPPGYGLQSPTLNVNVPVVRFARDLELTIPLRRQVPWQVRIVDADGEPVRDARVEGVLLGRARFWTPPTVPVRGSDAVQVLGVPFLRGEEVRAFALLERGDLVWRASSDAVTLREPGETLVCVVRLPREGVRRGDDVGIGGGAGGAFGGRRGGHRSLRGSSDRSAAIQVHVARRSGAPAGGAEVRLDGGATTYTDAAGDVRFESLRPGTYVVRVTERGFVPASAAVSVASQETARIEIREPEGASLDVQVLDEEGRPSPFAAVEVRVRGADGTWEGHVELDAEVQVLAPAEHDAIPQDAKALRLTDVAGRLTLRHVPPGDVRIRAWFGSRSASANASAPGWVTLRLGSAD